MLNDSRLRTILEGFPTLTIALVGDLFLDRYLEIEAGVREVSIETGSEAYQVPRVRNAPGALGTVMNNLAALGIGRLRPVAVIGDDGHGYDLLQEIRRLPVDDDFIVQDPKRLTPTYTKPLQQDEAGVLRELNRFDVRSREPLSFDTCERLCQRLRTAFEQSDGLIVLDQVEEPNWGVINRQVRSVLADLARQDREKLIFVDSRAHLGEFSCGILKGNRSELLAAVGLSVDSPSALQDAARKLAVRTGNAVFATLGGDGILIARPAGEVVLAPGMTVKGPIDIVGAGDSATSGIVASLLSGADEFEAAQVANLVASITIEQLGTTGTATPEQVVLRRSETSPD